jgi:RNA polymerase sigma factor (TIGR02999 family)
MIVAFDESELIQWPHAAEDVGRDRARAGADFEDATTNTLSQARVRACERVLRFPFANVPREGVRQCPPAGQHGAGRVKRLAEFAPEDPVIGPLLLHRLIVRTFRSCRQSAATFGIMMAMTDVTQLLNAISGGDRKASAELLPLVYAELRQLAAQRLAREKPGQTLEATALVHEAYLRLVSPAGGEQQWNSRGHFFAAAAEAMRRILVDNARRKQSLKQGGQLRRREANLDQLAQGEISDDILAVDEALAKLAVENPAVAKLVELKFFAGLTLEEAALAIGVSVRTANRYWTYAKAYLHSAIHDDRPN